MNGREALSAASMYSMATLALESFDELPALPKHGMEGVGTHQLVLALLQAAKEGRLVLLVDTFKAMMRFDQYVGSVEELTILRGDPWSFLVLVVVVLMLLVGGKT